MVSIDGREITSHYCEMVTKLAPAKDIGGHRFYLLGRVRRPHAEVVAKVVREFGYNVRIIDDFGTALYIKKSSKRKRR